MSAAKNIKYFYFKMLESVSSLSRSPSVSVIMPVYNAVEYLTQSVSSVFNQGVDSLELIMVDDGSNDGSQELAMMLASQESRIRVMFNRRPKGVSGARNTGIEQARGRYISFLDADDAYEIGTLAARLKAFSADRDRRLVHGRVRLVSKTGEYLGLEIFKHERVSFEDSYASAIHLNVFMGDARNVKQFRFDEEIANGEDWLFIASMLRSGLFSDPVIGPGAIYRFHPLSVTLQDYATHQRSLLKVIDWIYGHADEPWVASNFRAGLSSPSKAQILDQRRLIYVVWLLINGKCKEFQEQLEDAEFARYLGELDMAKFAGSLKTNLVRRYLVPVGQLKTSDRIPRKELLSAMRESSLEAVSPQLFNGMCELTGLLENGQTVPDGAANDWRSTKSNIEADASFTDLGHNRWHYTHSNAPRRNWIVIFGGLGTNAGRSFAAELKLESDRAMTVEVSLGRYGDTDYEGTKQRVELKAGLPQSVVLKKRFATAHSALKIQVAVVELKGGGTAILAFDSFSVVENPG